MKRFTLVLFGFLAVLNISYAQDKGDDLSLSSPVETGENYEVYGSEFTDDAQFFALNYLVRNSKIFNGQEIATTGTIKQVCQEKGCFFILSNGENEARVTFEDYRFFIPTNSTGAEVRVVGVFKERDLSEKQAEYYAQDMGSDANDIELPKMEFNIVASTVKILDQ